MFDYFLGVDLKDVEELGFVILEMYCEVDCGLWWLIVVIEFEVDLIIVLDYGQELGCLKSGGNYVMVFGSQLVQCFGIGEVV